MFQPYTSASVNSSRKKREAAEVPEETYSRKVRIVVTSSSSDKGELRGANPTLESTMAERVERNAITRAQSIEVQPGEPTTRKDSWFSLFSSKKLAETEDVISVQAADDAGSEEATLQAITNKRDLEAGKTFYADVDKERYNINNLRVPAIMDQVEPDIVNTVEEAEEEEEEEILEDPYAEISPKEAPMKDEEEEENADDLQTEKRRFLMCLTSKFFFLLGSILFIALAAHDLQRVRSAGLPPLTDAEADDAPLKSVDDDGDPFIFDASNFTAGGDFEEVLAQEEAAKEERSGALAFESRRRRMQSNCDSAQTNWYTQYWENLPDCIKEAANLLGYDQPTWDAGESVYTDRLHWDELTPEQQTAAFLVFGYEEATWNDYVDRFMASLADTEPPSPSPTEAPTDAPVQDPSTGDANNENDSNEASGGEAGDAVGDNEDSAGDTGETGDQGSEGNEENEDGDQGQDEGGGSSISAFNNGYDINIVGEYPPARRGRTYKVLYILAAMCFLMVGVLDAVHQQLGFHLVMILAGVTGIMAGGFTKSNETGFHVCHSLSTHLFLLQAVLLIYSRLLLTYDHGVRRILNFADGMFALGALMNVVVSYMRYNETSVAMARAAVAAFVFWLVAAIIYVAITLMFWGRRTRAHATGKSTGTKGEEPSVQEQYNRDNHQVVENDDGDCEVSLADPDQKEI